MNKEFYRCESFVAENEEHEKVNLEYYLIQSEHPFKSGNINYMCYGVEIRMKKEKDSDYSEIESANEIFFSKDIAIEFINKIADEKVTPCTLEAVVSDVLIDAIL